MKDCEIKLSASEKADYFIREEKQFQLGFLETEKPHPGTKNLSDACADDLPAAIAMLGSVDRGIVPRAEDVFSSEEVVLLKKSLNRALESGGRIIISGCGATGRLAILLETAWRRACGALPSAGKMKDSVLSIMTGGDYALVRSVESFEDYMSFGRKQAEEMRPGKNDVFLAVTEGGETSSVIGSALYAAECGSMVFIAFNNPAEILCEKIERSKMAICHPKITHIDLCTGPMAVTGSTRMQATTIELLVLGHILQEVFCGIAGINFSDEDKPEKTFANLLDSLSSGDAVDGMSSWIDFESDIYINRGFITYFADKVLLDIFTDTTERAPTFMLPPFVKYGDDVSAQSWAFVKNPLYCTESAWREVLGREPRCIEWTEQDYRHLGASSRIANNPPAIGRTELMKFRIGNEKDQKRFSASRSVAGAVLSMSDVKSLGSFLGAFELQRQDYKDSKIIFIGDNPDVAADITVPCFIKETPLMIWEHLAVKLVMNTISTATMARLGRVKGNWMAWVEATNKKLMDRSTRLISELCGITYREACIELFISVEEIEKSSWAGKNKPSPVQHAITRIKAGKHS